MRKLQELKHLTWMAGFLALTLFTINLYSLLDFRAVAQTTIARIPASLAQGIGATSDSTEATPSIESLKFSCDKILNHEVVSFKAQSKKVQIQFMNCKDQLPLELINLTNGYQSTLFKAHSGVYSDLLLLTKGANEIHLRVEKIPAPLKLKILL